MQKLIEGVCILIVLILLMLISRYWFKKYQKINPVEVKVKDVRTYDQFFFHGIRFFYYCSIVMIIALTISIISRLLGWQPDSADL